MTIKEAEQMIIDAYSNYSLPEENKFQLIEALEFLIEATHDPVHMMHLGGIYYEDRYYDLALKYYEMAATYDHTAAYECLGYIWYYGRTGEVDYKKAFEYYSKAAERGDTVAAYKLADMYLKGYYVEKDYDKYCETIEKLYPKVTGTSLIDSEPVPEICLRLSVIRREQGRTDDAVRLLFEAREYLEEVLTYNPFWGNLRNMEWLIHDLYELIDCDMTDLGLFDLYYVLSKPCKVTFRYNNEKYEAESVEEDGQIVVRFGDKWYRSVQEFFDNACIGDDRVATLAYDIYEMEVKR